MAPKGISPRPESSLVWSGTLKEALARATLPSFPPFQSRGPGRFGVLFSKALPRGRQKRSGRHQPSRAAPLLSSPPWLGGPALEGGDDPVPTRFPSSEGRGRRSQAVGPKGFARWFRIASQAKRAEGPRRTQPRACLRVGGRGGSPTPSAQLEATWREEPFRRRGEKRTQCGTSEPTGRISVEAI